LAFLSRGITQDADKVFKDSNFDSNHDVGG